MRLRERHGPWLLAAATLAVALGLVARVQAPGIPGYAEAPRLALTAPEAGAVVELAVVEGQAVGAGDVLARLDPSALDAEIAAAEADRAALEARHAALDRAAVQDEGGRRAELARAEAERAAAEAEVRVLTRQLDELRRWRSEGVGGAGDLAAAELRLAEARARVDGLRRAVEARRVAADAPPVDPTAAHELRALEHRLAGLRERRARLTIRAPLDGQVVGVAAGAGAGVPAGAPLIEVLPARTHRVVACVPEHDDRLVPGARARVVPVVGGEAQDGVVEAVAGEVAPVDPRCRQGRVTWARPAWVRVEGVGLAPGVRARVIPTGEVGPPPSPSPRLGRRE